MIALSKIAASGSKSSITSVALYGSSTIASFLSSGLLLDGTPGLAPLFESGLALREALESIPEASSSARAAASRSF